MLAANRTEEGVAMTTYAEGAVLVRVDAGELRARRAQQRAAERARELADLLASRPDLRGAYAPADFAVDAVRWGV